MSMRITREKAIAMTVPPPLRSEGMRVQHVFEEWNYASKPLNRREVARNV